jgi:hypothetical protein
MTEFKDIENYPNYEICNEGYVRNKKTLRVLKTWKSNSGYDVVFLRCPDDSIMNKRAYVHRLVGSGFCPNPDLKTELDHIDRNKNNNHHLNLRWVTHSENMRNTCRSKNNLI